MCAGLVHPREVSVGVFGGPPVHVNGPRHICRAQHGRKRTFIDEEFALRGTLEEDREVELLPIEAQVQSIGISRVGGSQIEDRKSTRLNSSHVKISYAV